MAGRSNCRTRRPRHLHRGKMARRSAGRTAEWRVEYLRKQGTRQSRRSVLRARPDLDSAVNSWRRDASEQNVERDCAKLVAPSSLPQPSPHTTFSLFGTRCKSLIKVDVLGQAFGAFAGENFDSDAGTGKCQRSST